MPSTLPILRARRERRLARQRANQYRTRNAFLSLGMILSLLIAALILTAAFAYVSLTRDLPSIEILPHLLNPPDGLLLQPTRIYDRTAKNLLFTFAPDDSARRYIPLSDTNPQHLSKSLADALIAKTDPGFWRHSGYSLTEIANYESHPTLAQQLVFDLLLFNEPPSFRRALRERILAAQVTAQFGRTQILEWVLNYAHFGRYAFGADAASQLYFGKSGTQLTPAESAILAALSDSPSLNPYDAPETALQRGRETLELMKAKGFLSNEATANALGESPVFQTPPPPSGKPEFASAFTNLLLSQLDSRFPRARIERGGLTIISTLDYDLQKGSSCVTTFYAARLAGLPDPVIECEPLRFLSALPPDVRMEDSSASAVITDPKTGQILAVVGETFQAQETPLMAAHRPGSALDAFVYLTGFTRGLSPASLIWDIPGRTDLQNFDGEYHGPLRLRVALANDYQAPAAQVLAQMGVENVNKIASSFGVSREESLSLLDAAGAYGVFARQGVYFGQDVNDAFGPVAILKVEGNDGYRLYIDGAIAIDNWTKRSYGTRIAASLLEPGTRHDVRLVYFEPTGPARVRLMWDADEAPGRQAIDDAVALARRSDAAIVVAGVEEGEFRDRAFLSLPGRQQELIEAVAATGTSLTVRRAFPSKPNRVCSRCSWLTNTTILIATRRRDLISRGTRTRKH